MAHSIQTTVEYNNGANFTFDNVLIVVAGGGAGASLKGMGGVFPTNNPAILTNSGVQADSLDSFSAEVTEPGADEVHWIVVASGEDMYWDGLAWVASDGTFAQSTRAEDINAHADALDISAGVTLNFIAILHSADGTTTPNVRSYSFGYSFFINEPDEPGKCDVCGWAEAGSVVTFSWTPYFHGSHLVNNTPLSVVARKPDGYFEMTVTETATIELSPYIVEISAPGKPTLVSQRWTGVQVPNAVSATLSSITG